MSDEWRGKKIEGELEHCAVAGFWFERCFGRCARGWKGLIDRWLQVRQKR